MNKRNKIIVSIVGITIVLLALLGITYAYYLTRIEGNTNTNSISVTTANLKLTYGDGNTEILTSDTLLMPGEFEGTKDFTVTNNGNASVTYGVILEDMINPLKRPQDMKMILSCSSNKENVSCIGLNEMNLPSTNEFLVENTIGVGETHTYELKLRYIEAGEDQSIDMGKTISGKVNIVDSHDTVDMTGVVANYEEGDYVQVNSEPKISYITNDGKYKVVGLKPEQHTIAVYKKDGTLKGDKELTIKSGTSESISENEITITKDTRTITMNITAINTDNTITTSGMEFDSYNIFTEGTLAYQIYSNARNVTNEQILNGFAKYSETPLTKPGIENPEYLYDKKDNLSSEEEIFSVFSITGDSSKYYTFADNYESEVICDDYEDEDGNYYPCYDEFIEYTLKNTDGSPVATVQGFSNLEGKYLINVSGSSSETGVLSSSSLYLITKVVGTNIYYTEFYWDSSSSSFYNNYYTYGDDYEIDPVTGIYTIVNSDNSNVKTDKYINIFDDKIKNKYICNLYGYSNNRESNECSTLYKVSPNTEKYNLKYYTLTKELKGKNTTLSYEKDDYGDSYYFRGIVSNNYLNFAGMCWRIVRIQGNNSIKIILEDKNTTCESSSADWSIGTANYGYNNYAYGKYKMAYQYPVTEKEKSMSYIFYNFQKTRLNQYLNYLYQNEWCFDNSAYNEKNGLTKVLDLDSRYNGKDFYYGMYVRKNNKEYPTLLCEGIRFDEYYDGTAMYVATLNMDEYYFSGSSYTTNSEKNRTTYLSNFNDKAWWTMSPGYSNGNHDYPFLINRNFGANTSESVYRDYYSVRPVIVLKTDTFYVSGDGTKTNPYVIE